MFSLNYRLNRAVTSFLVCAPLMIFAQAEMMMRAPAVPDPIPPLPKNRDALYGSASQSSASPSKSVQENGEKNERGSGPLSDEGQVNGSEEKVENPFDKIIDFWFGSSAIREFSPQDKFPLWFGEDKQASRLIRDRFGDDVLSAERGKYNEWRQSPRGSLALVLLLDVFPRRIYQGERNEFMFDKMAKAIVIEGIQKGDDRKLYPIERAFFYLPLEHSEDLETQNLSVSLYEKLLADSPLELKGIMQDFLVTAVHQRELIARFGRFPYRNAILGRESTPEEIIFLNQKTNKRI